MAKGKNYRAAMEKVDRTKQYPALEALELVKGLSFEKFDATVECVARLNIDPRKADQNLRGAIVLPHGTGKVKRVLVFAQGDKVKEAQEAGADYIGDDEIVAKIQGGWFDFDTVVATPDMMAQVGKLGRVLGPRGLMPNPKTGTVTMDVKKAVEEIKAGKIEYRTDKVGNIHVPIGKVSFTPEKLLENMRVFFDTMMKSKPATAKGIYVKTFSIASSMGPGVKVDIGTVLK